MNYIFFALAIFIVENHSESVFVPAPVSKQCLQCICESTNGIFRISKKYWESAGSPLLDNATTLSKYDGQFDDCVLDETCATKTVQLYMDKNQRDCDGDGVIDCYDYGALHLRFPENCETPPPNAQFFRDCSQRCIMI